MIQCDLPYIAHHQITFKQHLLLCPQAFILGTPSCVSPDTKNHESPTSSSENEQEIKGGGLSYASSVRPGLLSGQPYLTRLSPSPLEGTTAGTWIWHWLRNKENWNFLPAPTVLLCPLDKYLHPFTSLCIKINSSASPFRALTVKLSNIYETSRNGSTMAKPQFRERLNIGLLHCQTPPITVPDVMSCT